MYRSRCRKDDLGAAAQQATGNRLRRSSRCYKYNLSCSPCSLLMLLSTLWLGRTPTQRNERDASSCGSNRSAEVFLCCNIPLFPGFGDGLSGPACCETAGAGCIFGSSSFRVGRILIIIERTRQLRASQKKERQYQRAKTETAIW